MREPTSTTFEYGCLGVEGPEQVANLAILAPKGEIERVLATLFKRPLCRIA